MPSNSDIQIPPPTDWQAFQRICCDLWKSIWDNPNIQEYGRIGQRQNGVDIQGRIKNSDKYGGIQCKEKDGLADKKISIKELNTEVEKAKKFYPPLSEFIIAFTGQKDVVIQDEANRLTEVNRAEGLFSVTIWSWEDIRLELTSHLNLLQKHFPQVYGYTSASESKSKEIISEITEKVESSGNVIGSKLDGLSAGVAEIRQTILEQTFPIDTEIAHTKTLIDSYQLKACLSFIEGLIKTKWEKCSSKSKFKLLTNKGSCLLQQGHVDEAAYLFIEALQFNGEDEKAFTNAALAFFLLKDRISAQKNINVVLSKNPLNLQAWNLLIQFTESINEYEEIILRIPQSILSKSEIHWARSVVLQRLDFNSEAEKYLESALLTCKEKNVELLVQYGSLKLKNCLDNHKIVASRKPTPEAIAILNEVISLLSEAIKIFSESDIVPTRIQAILNRGIAYRILGKTDESKKDLEQIIEWNPNDYQATKHRLIMAIAEGKYETAITRLVPFAIGKNIIEAKILLADSYRLNKQYPDCISLVEKCNEWTTDNNTKIQALTILLECQIEIEDKPAALNTVMLMKAVEPESYIPFVHQARVEKLFGDKEIARKIILTAKSLVGNEIDFFDEWKLADELFYLELYSDAAFIYSRIATPGNDDGITRKLIESYYYAEIWDKALESCYQLKASHPEVQYVSELASAILESSGNLPEAILTLRAYLKLNSKDDNARLRLASIFHRSGNKIEFIKELSLIEKPQDLGPKGILHYGSLLSGNGDVDSAIKILYEARRKYPNDPEIDMSYIWVILGRSEQISILEDPSEVGTDSVVFLESSFHENIFYIIEDRIDVDIHKNEINMDNPITKELIGKKNGDKIDLDKNPIQPRSWTISLIKNKYTHTLHEAMETHPRRFPNRGDFFSITTPTDKSGEIDGEEFRRQMIAALPSDSGRISIDEFYKMGKLTIGSVANLAKKDILSTMVYLSSHPDLGIYTGTGTVRAYEKALFNIQNTNGIVIDLTSIITMEHLNIKDLILDKYGPFIITQSTLDELNKLYVLRSVGGMKSSFTIFQEKGELYRHEVSIDDKKKQLDHLAGLISWLVKNATIKPVNLLLNMKKSEKEKMEQYYSTSLSESLLVAKEHDLALYSEDGRLREIAESEFKTKGIWTHTILKDALEKKYIDKNLYEDYTISLLELNIHHISINSDIIIAAARKSFWRVDYPLTSTLINLSGWRCNEESAIIVGSEFIYSLWMQTIDPINKNSIVMAVLEAITIMRNKETVAKKMIIYITQRFILWPQASRSIVIIIEGWIKTKIV